jgi:FkbM family methyltransferase
MTFAYHEGLWWPDADKRARPILTREVQPAMEWVLRHVEGRDMVIQAGGNVGLYPLALSDVFENVITAEPDEDNFQCLEANLRARMNVYALRGAFGDEAGGCHSVVVEPDNCGAHRIDKGGETPLVTIDALAISDCDLIWLDVEGYELQALHGAANTLKTFSPVVVTEEKHHGLRYGYEDAAIADFLHSVGYALADTRANDRLYRRTHA